MPFVVADVIIRVRQLPGSMRTPNVDIISGGIKIPGGIDRLKARRWPEVMREPEAIEIPNLQIVPEGLDMPQGQLEPEGLDMP